MPEIPDAGKQFVIAVNRLGSAVEHLARSIDNTTLFFADIAKRGHDPVSFVENIAGTVGRIMDNFGQKKPR
jgi:hypothetical protein